MLFLDSGLVKENKFSPLPPSKFLKGIGKRTMLNLSSVYCMNLRSQVTPIERPTTLGLLLPDPTYSHMKFSVKLVSPPPKLKCRVSA